MIKQKQIAGYGLYLLLILLPFQTRYFLVERSIGGAFFEYGSFTVYATEILLWFLVLYEIFWFLFRKRYKNIRPDERVHRLILKFFQERPIIAWSLIFLSYAALSALWSVNREQTLFYIIRLTEALLVLWLITLSREKKRSMLLTFVIGVALQSAFGIYQFFTQIVSGSSILGIATQIPDTRGVAVVETELRRYLRAYGGLPHPNILGGWIVAGLIALVALIYDSAIRAGAFSRSRLVLPFLLVYSLLFTALILTFSRSAGAAFVLGIGVFFAYGVFHKKTRYRGLELLCLTAILSIFFGILLKEPLTERGTGLVFNRNSGRLEQKSSWERSQGLRDAWILYKKNPLLGSGLGTYTTALARLYPERPVYEVQPAHSVPVLISVELGIVGAFFAFLSFYHIVAYLLRRRKILGIALFCAFLAFSLFDHYLWTLYSGVLLIGVCFGFGIVSDDE